MKKIIKSFAYAAVAALALASCAKENIAPKDNLTDKMVEVNFGAVSTVDTKATLTPNEAEDAFAAAWTNGDQILVTYENDNITQATTAVATWDGTSFKAELPEYTGTWEYKAVYPVPEDLIVDFGGNRTQTGAAYNSKYDLMLCGESVMTENAPAGKTDAGKDVVLPMVRQTAIAYFHFTSDNTEDITKATLSVEGGNIAAGTMMLDPSGVAAEDEVSEIVTTVSGQTAKDFTLWFNVLPTAYTSMTLSVETASGKTFSITKSTEGEYVAGKLYKVKKENIKWEGGEEPQTPVFIKVTEEPTDWSGEYLIVLESINKAYRGSLTSTFNGSNTVPNVMDVTIADGKIEATETIKANTITIAKAEDKYSIQTASGYYIGYKGTSNGLTGNKTYSTDTHAMTIILDNGYVKITSPNTDEQLILCNIQNNLNYVRFYKPSNWGTANYVSPTLYKLVGEGGSETPSDPVAVENVTLDKSELTLTVGGTATLEATITPDNATDKTITWTSSAPSVATVENGVVTAVKEGTATITVASKENPALTASCEVTVNPYVDTTPGTGDGTETSPYSADRAYAKTAELEKNGVISNVYVTGVISSVTSYNSTYGSITYNISPDGTTTSSQLMVYGGLSFNGEKFAAQTDLKVGDVVVVLGELKNYNGNQPEVNTNSVLISLNGKGALKNRNLAYDPATATITVGEAWTAPTLTGDLTGATVFYVSSNTALATVTAEGAISLVADATGTAKITATVDADETYAKATAEYTITVKATSTEELTTIVNTFTDKNWTVSEANGLSWSSSVAANSFETASPNRGVQVGSAKGEVTITGTGFSGSIKAISMIVSTNGTANTNTIDVTVGGKILGSQIKLQKSNNFEIQFESTDVLTGDVVIKVNDSSKSVYFKSITINPTN